jgi:transcriptional regulator with XRE-family HTH domain
MDGKDALSHIIKADGKPYRTISTELGRSPNFVSNYLATKRSPDTDLLADVANVCGYRLQLVGHGEVLTLGPDLPDAQGVDGLDVGEDTTD